MTDADKIFLASGFRVSAQGAMIYAAALRASAAEYAKLESPGAAALAEILREAAQGMDQALKAFDQNLIDFSNGK